MSDKTIVLITGGNGGIGFLTAESIATASSKHHVIIASRSLEKGETALKELQAKPLKGTVSLVQMDVSSQESIEAAFAKVSSEFGRLDVLINNAGIFPNSTPFLRQLRETFETNTFGAAITTETFSPLLSASPDPRLVYVSSDLGSITERGTEGHVTYGLLATAYRMSKAALNMLMVCNVVEFKQKGVGLKAWAYNPGYVVTNLSGGTEQAKKDMIAGGAGDAKPSADALADIVFGKRDSEAGGYIDKKGKLEW